MKPTGSQCFGSVERRLELVGRQSTAPCSACLLNSKGFNAYMIEYNH